MAATSSTSTHTFNTSFDLSHTSHVPLEVALLAFQEEFDESDIFNALVEWDVGIPNESEDFEPYTPKQSYELFLGVTCEEIMPLGLSQGSDLRALGINTDIKLYCNRLKTAVKEERALLFSKIMKDLIQRAEIWSDKKSHQEYINWINSFSISEPSPETIFKLTRELIALYHNNDLEFLHRHLQAQKKKPHRLELPPADLRTASASTCIFKKLELFDKLKEAVRSPAKDDIQVVLLEIQANVTPREYNLIARKLCLFTAKIQQISGSEKEMRQHGIKAFLHQAGYRISEEEQMVVIELVRALSLLRALSELIVSGHYAKIQYLLNHLEKIKFAPIFKFADVSLSSYLYHTLATFAGRSDTEVAQYGKEALTNKSSLTTEIKVQAVKNTIMYFNNIINKS